MALAVTTTAIEAQDNKIGVNVVLNDGVGTESGVEVFDRNYLETVVTGQGLAGVQARLISRIQADIDAVKTVNVENDNAGNAAAVIAIQAALNVTES